MGTYIDRWWPKQQRIKYTSECKHCKEGRIQVARIVMTLNAFEFSANIFQLLQLHYFYGMGKMNGITL